MISIQKPTPGPYEVVEAGKYLWVVKKNEGRPSSVLAEIRADGLNAHANARLMAASWELADALQETLEAHQSEGAHHEDLCSVCRLAQGALAKAGVL
jgi:uncharacterized alpha-E superfamily protein